jgi:hypothetical protein
MHYVSLHLAKLRGAYLLVEEILSTLSGPAFLYRSDMLLATSTYSIQNRKYY